MIRPLNNYVQIEPREHSEFVQSADKTTYDEIGVVIAVDINIAPIFSSSSPTAVLQNPLKAGDIVYFDSWMASKFPVEGTDKYYWLVPFENIKAYETTDTSLSEKHVQESGFVAPLSDTGTTK